MGAERKWKDEIFIKQNGGLEIGFSKIYMMSGRGHFTTSKLRTSRILVVRFFAYIIPKMRTSTPETVATGNGKKRECTARNIPFLTQARSSLVIDCETKNTIISL